MASRRLLQNVIAKRLMSSEGTSVSAKYVSPVSSLGQYSHHVSPFEKRLLVWSGKYRSAAEVPTHVSRDTMERARNYYRIRVNIAIAAAAVVGCFVMVLSGKNAAHRGETIQQYNENWHRRYNETHPHDFHTHH